MRWYYDRRSVGKDGRCPLRLRIVKGGKAATPLTGIRIAPAAWDARANRPRDARLDTRLRDMLSDAEDLVLRLRMSGEYESMSLDELCGEISRHALALEPKPRAGVTLASRIEAYRDRQPRRGTREVYDRTLKALRVFDPDFDRRSFGDVDHAYLRRLEGWWLQGGRGLNGLSVMMRNIRTIFNEARRDEVTSLYPFSRYRIRQEPTRKRSLDDSQIRTLLAMPLPPDQERYRDFFLLMLYLIGANPADLFTATPQQLRDGRLEYRRAKTGRLYSVKVEPEAMEIINKYRGRGFLLEPLDSHGDFLSWRTQLNKRLKALGQETGKRGKVTAPGPLPFLSTYWARHTWATVAYRVGVPVDVIAQALGHSDRSRAVTMIYINPDEARVDAANRKVIDHILSLREK